MSLAFEGEMFHVYREILRNAARGFGPFIIQLCTVGYIIIVYSLSSRALRLTNNNTVQSADLGLPGDSRLIVSTGRAHPSLALSLETYSGNILSTRAEIALDWIVIRVQRY